MQSGIESIGVEPRIAKRSLPPGTVVSSMRSTQSVLARLPDGATDTLFQQADLPETRVSQRRYFSPYGIAYDSAREGFWLADKLNASIWFLTASADAMPNSLIAEKEYRHGSLSEPCGLDFHPRNGLLIGGYGDSTLGTPGGVFQLADDRLTPLVQFATRERVTHCCWLPDGGFCYVTRSDSILWHCPEPGQAARPLTLRGERMLCPDSGPLGQLRLRYVHGLVYSPLQQCILIADAALGAIYKVDLRHEEFSLYFGRPTLGHSNSIADVRDDPNVWLGRIAAMAEDTDGSIVWLEGSRGNWFRFRENRIEAMGPALPGGQGGPLLGCGVTIVR